MLLQERNINNVGTGGRAIRLLIVDDSPQDVWLIQRLINQDRLRAHEIWTASNGQDGLALFSGARPDCVLLDYMLPDMTGIDFLDRLALPDGTLPTGVVVITASVDAQIATEAMKRGSTDCISKVQLSTERLHRAIGNAMEKASLRLQLREHHAELAQLLHTAADTIGLPLQAALKTAQRLQKVTEEQATTTATDGEFPEWGRQLAILRHSIASAQKILSSLESYGRFIQKPASLHPVDLQNLVDGVLFELHELVEIANGTIQVAPLPTVLGDEESLRCVMRHILLNALEAARPVALRVTITATLRNNDWQITVADNGKGIEASAIPHILDPFYTSTSATGERKAGMGLAICQQIIRHHGGSIWLNSRVGRGTKVHFLVPQIGYRPAVDGAARPLGEELVEVNRPRQK